MTTRFKTLAIDSGGELARLAFSYDMKKHAKDMSSIRMVNNYPGATERINMLARRFRDIRNAGVEVVLICHEGIDKLYAGKTGAIPGKGEQAQEPAAVKGRIDLPGNTAPEEVMRIADNIFRVRLVNGKPMWVTIPESLPGASGAIWQVKNRFWADSLGATLPPSYSELKAKALEKKLAWAAPYIWVLYGNVGFGKTRSLLTFPRPIKILDIDQGTSVIDRELTSDDLVVKFNSEECDDWDRFIKEMEDVLTPESEVSKMKEILAQKSK